MRACLACGESLEDAHQLRKYCDDACKKRFQRGARSGPVEEDSKPQVKPAGVVAVAAATLEALGDAGKLHTPGGQAALKLAHRIDNSDRDTGAGLASMVKRLEETLASILADVEPEADAVDELKARRDRKRDAAAG